MKNARIKRPSILMSLVGIVISISMLMGATFAWFTDQESNSSNIIKSGSLDVSAYWMDATLDPSEDSNWVSFGDGAMFNYDKWEPGYVDAKHLMVKNDGTLAFKYKVTITPNGTVSSLANVIDVYYVDQATKLSSRSDLENGVYVGTLSELIRDVDGAAYGVLLPEDAVAKNQNEVVGSKSITIALKMREDVGNEYLNKSIGTDFSIQVYASQYSYEEDIFGNDYDVNASPDTWNGTADFSWYIGNEDQDTFSINSAEQFVAFASLVNGKANETQTLSTVDGLPTSALSFEGKTVKLETDVDLFALDENFERVSFQAIGDTKKGGTAFKGEFDGQGHAIENLYQSGWAFGYEWGSYGSLGLFSEIDGATVKNLKINGTDSFVEGGDVSFIAGSATGDCVFENITIEDSSIGTFNNGCGGIIGWSGEGTYTFKNITIAEDVVLGGLWGSFDSSIGGIVGQAEPGAMYNFENVNVACRIDAYNDCTASYDYYNYRMCGMLIGRLEETMTIDGVNYPDVTKYNITCNNVVVTYGEWANYHYCDPTTSDLNNGRGMRVEAGYQYGGIPADYDHALCIASGQHMHLIPFDQIFGGDQIGVKGLKSYDGVTVIYNNK